MTNDKNISIITNVMGSYMGSTGIMEIKWQVVYLTLQIKLNIAGNNYNNATGYAFA